VRTRELLSGGLRIGCVAPDDARGVRDAEDLGVDSLWVGGHIASRNPGPEAMVWLARLVEQTSSVVVGSAVLLLPLYPPAIVAKQVADLDRASGGRLVLGIGAGGEYPEEFSACQVPLNERGGRMNEAIPLMRRLWSGELVTHPGPHYPMADVRIHPGPAREGGPPIVVAGRQPVAMRRAGQLADGWMPYMYSPRRYRESVREVCRFGVEAGRELDDFAWLAYVPVCIDDDADRARRDAAAFLGGTYRQDFERLVMHIGAAGTVTDVVARLREYVDAGARHLVLLPCRPDEQQLARLLDEVVPRIRSRQSASRSSRRHDSL